MSGICRPDQRISAPLEKRTAWRQTLPVNPKRGKLTLEVLSESG